MRFAVPFILAVLLLAGCTGREPEPAERWIAEELGTRAEFRDLFFLDDQRGWIVGGGHNITGGIIGSTTDGGNTWSFKSAVAKPSTRAGNFHLNAVCFLDARTGFIVGDGFRILRTLDGGEHWHRLRPARGGWAHLHDLQFVDPDHGWAVGPGGLARTVDGGVTWEGPLAIDPEAERPRETTGQALHFVDRRRGWIVGKFGMILSTADGGESWARIEGPPGLERIDLWGIDFTDDLHGWAVGGDGKILHTADGGKSWRWQSSGVPDTLMDVDFIDAARGWAVGFDRSLGSATVLRTTDGGATWTEQARVESEAMRALFVLSDRKAWAVGEQQRRSDDDGSQKLLRYEVDRPEG